VAAAKIVLPLLQIWLALAAVLDSVADVPLTLAKAFETVVAAFPWRCMTPVTSQSPGVSDIEVTLAATPFVNATAAPVSTAESMISPTSPATALSLVGVPTNETRSETENRLASVPATDV
jgi:hypothetical protein